MANWHKEIDQIEPYVAKISTPQAEGTGFLIAKGKDGFAVATAAHVVRDAYAWNQNIGVELNLLGEQAVIRTNTDKGRRKVHLHPALDSAVLEVTYPEGKDLAALEKLIELIPPGETVPRGVEVGWVGYPYLVPSKTLCFFSGPISAVAGDRYFIDGVSVAGVSGGPAFCMRTNATTKKAEVRILGSITAYRPARSGGEVLPGLMVAENVSWMKPSIGDAS